MATTEEKEDVSNCTREGLMEGLKGGCCTHELQH